MLYLVKKGSTVQTANTQEKTRQSPNCLGMVLFLISEFFLFSSLFWTYYQLRAETPVWPPPGVQLNVTLPVINTVILVVSSFTVWLAERAIRKNNRSGLAAGITITMTLGAVFLGITIWEWLHETFRPWSHAYGSIIYTLTGFHALHVFGGIILMLALLLRTLRGRFSANNYLAVGVGSLYWHFVDVIWLIVFTSIFIVR